MIRELTRQDAEDLRQGTLILGCGGGGDPQEGVSYIDQIYSMGRAFTLATIEDLPNDALVVTVGFVGGGITEDELQQVEAFEKSGDAVLRAVDELSAYLGKEITAYMPSEPGAGNSFVPLYAAAMKGAVTLDVDTAGRAKPEVVNSTTSIFDVPLTPLSMVSNFGDVMIVRHAVDERRVEHICRYMARASGGMCAVARCPITLGNMKGKFIEGSLTLALAAGRSIRESDTPVAALIETLRGVRLFDGEIISCSRKEEGGFMWGEIKLVGVGEFASETYKLWYKNENLIGWRNGRLDVTTPDLIALVDAQTGEGIYNWSDDSLVRERRCTVIGRKADPLWLSPRGLELFGPRHFGFDFDYLPFNKRDLAEEDACIE